MPCFTIRSLLLTLIICAGDGVLAQGGDDSPYSSFGFGDLIGTPQAGQALMGGTGIAVIDQNSAIQANPASYAGMRWPHIEIAAIGHFSQLSSNGLSATRNNARLLDISIGVPFGTVVGGDYKWGVAVGVQPVTEVGYLIEESSLLSSGNEVRMQYAGSGGLNRAFAGLGGAIWQERDSLGNGRRLTAGVNLNYLFGSVEQTRKAYYPVGLGYYNPSFFSALTLNALTASVGVHFQGDIVPARSKEDDGLRYLIGLVVEPGANLNAHRNATYTTFNVINGVELTRDTISTQNDQRGTVMVPPAYGLGVSIYDPYWTITAEARSRDWREVRVEVEGYDLPTTFARSTTYAVGAAWRPAGDRGVGSFLERSTWRFGLRYSDDYMVVKDTQLNEMGVSMGVSLPVLGNLSRSRLTLGVELGQRGTEDNGLILERFADLFVGFTLTPEIRQSKWFKKRQIE